MGLAFSCPVGERESFDDSFKDLLRSISFSEAYERSNLRSVSFNGRDSEPAHLKAFGSGKLIIEGSVSFKRKKAEPFQLETKISIKSPSSGDENTTKAAPFKRTRFSHESLEVPRSELGDSKHDASALKLQKVYKSFRTRRQLADCAILVEQRWWKLLDFALLKRSSVSFFDIEKPESIISKWSRARTRAAKVGKGLSKDARARKLALEHWLEAIDPRHRYGHNLQFYYDSWLHCESKQPFFYWLDVGEGKEVNLKECSRSMLQHQCIRYLGPKERDAYEAIVEDGKLIYKKSRECLDTAGGPEDPKWIFVLSTSKKLYVGRKRKGMFQHSSFLAGGATSAAGRLVVENGVLKAVWPHSGHYRPTEENFEEFMSFLKENNVNLSEVEKAPAEDDNEWGSKLQGHHLKSDLANTSADSKSELEANPSNIPVEMNVKATMCEDTSSSSKPKQETDKDVEMEKFYSFSERTRAEEEDGGVNICTGPNEGCETSEQSRNESVEQPSLYKRQFGFCKPNLFIGEQEDTEKEPIPKKEILQRLSSKKGLMSYQLGKQLSFKWTTGAGPRIGCVRDYPSKLQFRALEEVSLSPRGCEGSRPCPSPRGIPSPMAKDTRIICTGK